MMRADTSEVTAFVDQIRTRRAASGKPDHFTDESVYRILDGLLAGRGREVPNDAA